MRVPAAAVAANRRHSEPAPVVRPLDIRVPPTYDKRRKRSLNLQHPKWINLKVESGREFQRSAALRKVTKVYPGGN